MPQKTRTWMDIAKAAAERLLNRPFANRLAWLVAGAGILVIIGPPILVLVLNQFSRRLWQVEIPIQPPGPLEYGVGLILVFAGLIFSGWIHYVTTSTTATKRQNDVSLDIELLDREGNPLPECFRGRMFTIQNTKAIPDYRSAPRGAFDFPNISENRDYHREWFRFAQAAGNALFMRFRVRNSGQVSARNLVVKITFDANGTFDVLSERHFPDVPAKITDYGAKLHGIVKPTDTKVVGCTAEFVVAILNPEDEFRSTTLIAVRPQQSGTITATARAFAEDLPTPIASTFTIRAEISEVELTVSDVVAGKIPKPEATTNQATA